MPTTSANRQRQTSKQAKAAYKARGQTSVSDAEKRKLARGAELLARAARCKEQEKRKKEWLKKRGEEDVKPKSDKSLTLLGTQRRLDRFGYKSSQFHLGNFVRPVGARPVSEPDTNITDPWEDEDIDESLLNDAVPDDAAEKHRTRKPSTVQPSEAPTPSPSPVPSLGGWEDFLESGTQIARELAIENVPPLKQQKPTLHNSFSSDDMGFDEDDLQELDNALQKAESQFSKSQEQRDRLAMPPPIMPLKARISSGKPQAVRQPPALLRRYDSKQAPNIAAHDISRAELESLVADDIMLSQWPG